LKVGIVGGGLLGITLGYLISKKGIQVDIWEASSSLGGLAGSLTLDDGTVVDRYYHALLPSDSHLRQLCTELDLNDQLRFHETKMGFYHQGNIYSMNNVIEFLRFPPLNWIDRFRLGLTVVYAQLVKDWQRLEGVSVQDWLIRLGGKRTFENIWRPLLKAKFDGGFDNTPATYIWARLVRTKSTRAGASQKEESGHLIGGYMTMIEAMVERIQASGGGIHLASPVSEIAIDGGRAQGLRIGDRVHSYDKVAVTVQLPLFRQMIPGANRDYLDLLSRSDYLGLVCPLLVLDRPLTDFWTLNITADYIPFTGIIETTSYIDPQYVGGHHLVYLPKYTAPGSKWQEMSDQEIREIWLENLQAMFPQFDPNWVQCLVVHRERYVEPIHPLNSTGLIPEIETPVQDLFLATSAQIYPALTNSESIAQHAYQAAQTMLDAGVVDVAAN
jgi:protoporphyrinogen oxidase